MLVLWSGREFYRGKYLMTVSSQAWTPDLGDKFGDLGYKSKIPENTILFSISLLGEETRLNACQHIACLRGSAAEFLQDIPADKLTDLSTIEKALESRFGNSHLTQFYRTKLKTRRQKPCESLQVLAADVERLMSLAYAECPKDVRDSQQPSTLSTISEMKKLSM
ncbi:hypothetical protein AVEN_174352-1 [Araneus ventricosus]|nr:hypothetical protein AVEN_58456-1 [Araneus ventricosus]GBM01281.1 hypothetical protein AVEN_136604-1 [Araneus ventricosus]GBM01316.1 hypothetical protein AVEN_174352-1 [Araneus ventricosus]